MRSTLIEKEAAADKPCPYIFGRWRAEVETDLTHRAGESSAPRGGAGLRGFDEEQVSLQKTCIWIQEVLPKVEVMCLDETGMVFAQFYRMIELTNPFLT